MSEPEPTQDPPVWHRTAARLLLLDEALTHVLLLQVRDPRRPDRPYWVTVGGGVDEGESDLEAVVREAHEEVGLVLDPSRLDGPVGSETVEFSFDGTTIRQTQAFYVAVTPRFDPVFVGVDDVERDSTLRVAWVALAALHTLPDLVYPANLRDLVATWRRRRPR